MIIKINLREISDMSLKEAVVKAVCETIPGTITTKKVQRKIQYLGIKPDALYRILSSLDKKGHIPFTRKSSYGRKKEC